jgi:hypothetical protein
MKSHFVKIVVAVVIFAFFGLRTAGAQDRGPSTPEERARAVKVAHQLETDPLAEGAREQRAWVVKWIIEIPDITVNVCFEYFGKVPDPPRGHSVEIAGQMIVSSAAFMIEHPDKVKDQQAVAKAGLLGSLKIYESVLKQDSTARWPYLDNLIQMLDQGKLDDYVSDTLTKCRQDGEESSPDTVRAAL